MAKTTEDVKRTSQPISWPFAVAIGLMIGAVAGGGAVLLLAVQSGPDSMPAPTADPQPSTPEVAEVVEEEPLSSPMSPATPTPPVPEQRFQSAEPLPPIPWSTFLRNRLPEASMLSSPPEDPLLDLTDPDQLEEMLRRRDQTIPELYPTLSYDQRADLIVALNAANLLSPHLESFLTFERRSDLRALLLECIDPVNFAASEETPAAALMAILDLPTMTPIDGPEWVARMELGCQIDPAVGAEWVRSARGAFPDSASVTFTASLLTLVHAYGSDAYSNEEARTASEELARLMNGRLAIPLSAESRIRAYYAMTFAPDPASAIAFFRQRLTSESDPRARDVLVTLQARLLVQVTPLP